VKRILPPFAAPSSSRTCERQHMPPLAGALIGTLPNRTVGVKGKA
jgi:hypothetical protein